MEISDKIKAAGLKVTPQRKAVYKVMQDLGHSSVEEVVSKVRTFNPDITLSTIYRIMDSFYQAGLLSKFTDSYGKTIFDITVSGHHHIFTAEDMIVDVEDQQLTEIIKQRFVKKIPEDESIEQISVHITTKKSLSGKENVNFRKRSSDSG